MAESIKLVFGITCCFMMLCLSLNIMMLYPQHSRHFTVPIGASCRWPEVKVNETDRTTTSHRRNTAATIKPTFATGTTKTVSNRSTVFSRTLLHGKDIKADANETDRRTHVTSRRNGRNAATIIKPKFATPTTKTVSNRSTVFSRTLIHGKGINFDIDEYFTMAPNETKDPFVNQHQYNYTLNSQVCAGRKLFLIMLIHSAPGNIRKRNNIRNTFGTVKTYKDKEIASVFLLAVPQDQADQIIINMESKLYNDIVQGNFLDAYKNLIRKHIMAMQWFKGNCAAEYILKLDDDTFVNPFRTVEYLLDKPPVGKTMHCYVLSNEMPIRDSRSKWHTPKSQYPFAMFPPFCIGFAYLTTPQTWAAMLRVSGNSRKMDMDDVYVSVVLAIKAAVTKVDFSNRVYGCPSTADKIDVQRLNTKILVIDRYRRCESKLFNDDNWKKLRDMNKYIGS